MDNKNIVNQKQQYKAEKTNKKKQNNLTIFSLPEEMQIMILTHVSGFLKNGKDVSYGISIAAKTSLTYHSDPKNYKPNKMVNDSAGAKSPRQCPLNEINASNISFNRGIFPFNFTAHFFSDKAVASYLDQLEAYATAKDSVEYGYSYLFSNGIKKKLNLVKDLYPNVFDNVVLVNNKESIAHNIFQILYEYDWGFTSKEVQQILNNTEKLYKDGSIKNYIVDRIKSVSPLFSYGASYNNIISIEPIQSLDNFICSVSRDSDALSANRYQLHNDVLYCYLPTIEPEKTLFSNNRDDGPKYAKNYFFVGNSDYAAMIRGHSDRSNGKDLLIFSWNKNTLLRCESINTGIVSSFAAFKNNFCYTIRLFEFSGKNEIVFAQNSPFDCVVKTSVKLDENGYFLSLVFITGRIIMALADNGVVYTIAIDDLEKQKKERHVNPSLSVSKNSISSRILKNIKVVNFAVNQANRRELLLQIVDSAAPTIYRLGLMILTGKKTMPPIVYILHSLPYKITDNKKEKNANEGLRYKYFSDRKIDSRHYLWFDNNKVLNISPKYKKNIQRTPIQQFILSDKNFLYGVLPTIHALLITFDCLVNKEKVDFIKGVLKEKKENQLPKIRLNFVKNYYKRLKKEYQGRFRYFNASMAHCTTKVKKNIREPAWISVYGTLPSNYEHSKVNKFTHISSKNQMYIMPKNSDISVRMQLLKNRIIAK